MKITHLCYLMLMNVNACLWGSYYRANYSICAVEILDVTAEKDLGVAMCWTTDSSLQCAKVVSAANKVLCVIMRTYVYSSQSNIVYFYKSLVRPHL